MKKVLWIMVLVILVIGIVIFILKENDNENTRIAERRSEANLSTEKYEENNIFNQTEKEKIEEKLAEFSTKLPNDTKSRDDNIELACKKLDGTIVKAEESFSFWDNLGSTTKEKGYKKAKTFTSDGQVIQSYGGGVCQISTTIYNAVLKVNGLKIEERHEHSREVTYIEDGKDAAVSYGSADFRFKNNLDYDIKIEAKVEEREVKIKLIRI